MPTSPLGYDDLGDGSPVLLIHGFPLCRQMWQPQLRALRSAGWRGIAPDLPGFGASPPGEKPWTMDRYADELVLLLDDLGLERVVVAGMSMGGYVLMNLLERYPRRVRAAVFVATRAAADDAAGRERRTRLAEAALSDRTEEIVAGFEAVLFAPATVRRRPELVGQVRAWMEQADPRGLAGGLLAMRDRPDFLEKLAGFDLPALVAAGEEDQAVGNEHYRTLLEGLPRAQGCLLPGGGHMVNLECAEDFNRCLVDFLRRLPQG
jgi:pimeloyl-ACP methyl ester carboxylesterase